MAGVGWRLLRAGSGRGAVLGVDFTLAKVRAQANFGDLAPQLPPGYAVWGADEAGWPAGPGVPAAQLAAWLAAGTKVDRPVRAVFGFCAGASLATALAGRLAGAGAGQSPAVVLFDPAPVSARTLIDLAEESLRRLTAGPALPPAPAAPPGQAPPGPVPGSVPDEPDADLARLASVLVGRYGAGAAAVGTARSIPPAIVDQLCQRVAANLRFLVLCATAQRGGRCPAETAPVDAPVASADLLVLSQDQAVPAALAGVPAVRVDTTGPELLADPRAAQAAARVLASPDQARP